VRESGEQEEWAKVLEMERELVSSRATVQALLARLERSEKRGKEEEERREREKEKREADLADLWAAAGGVPARGEGGTEGNVQEAQGSVPGSGQGVPVPVYRIPWDCASKGPGGDQSHCTGGPVEGARQTHETLSGRQNRRALVGLTRTRASGPGRT